MFETFIKLFRKDKNETKEYLSCRHLQGGITFMHDSIRTCCSIKQGIVFFKNYKGEKINWNKIYKERKKVINNCKKGILPENCKDCVDLEKKIWSSDGKIKEIYLNYWDHCNCGCVYCIVGAQGEYLVTEKKPSKYFSVYNHLKKLYDDDMISKDVHVELVGGDLTVLDEADDIINLCLDRGVSRMSFHSSCIYYSKGIERALKELNTMNFDFSIDCGNRELYKKIKRIDAFEQVITNIKKYLSISKSAKRFIVAKYIIIDGLNDSVEALECWIQLIHSLGIKNAKLEVNLRKYFGEYQHKNPTVPKHYYDMYKHYNKRIEELGIIDHCWEFSKKVMEYGGIPAGY